MTRRFRADEDFLTAIRDDLGEHLLPGVMFVDGKQMILPPLRNLKALELDEDGRVRRVEYYASGAESEADMEHLNRLFKKGVHEFLNHLLETT